MQKLKFYSSRNIDKTGAIYRLIIGERSNGKTYCFCKHALEGFMKNGYPSAYIRRFDTEFKRPQIRRMFNSMINETGDFQKIVKGAYDTIRFEGGIYWLIKFDEKNKIEEKTELLYTYTLNTWENDKGGDIGQVNYICYDEFCTRGKYLADEFIAFQNTVSTIRRTRTGIIIYLLANTVNEYCPLFDEFGIDITAIEQGKIYDFGNGVALEWCATSGNNSKSEYLTPFKNSRLDMIKTGAWEQAQYPHLPKNAKYDSTEFYFYINFNHKTVCGEIRQTPNGGLYIFFHYQTKPLDTTKDLITFNQVPTTDYLAVTNITRYAPTKIHKIIVDLIRANKLFYRSNAVGEFVRNWLLWQGVVITK